MRLNLTEEQEMVRETVRRFLENEAPLSSIRGQYDSPEGFSRPLWVEASQLGWTALGVPESAGGLSASGNPGQDLAIVAEEMGRLIGAGPFLPTSVSLLALVECPNQPLRDRLVPSAIAGETILGWAFGEPGNLWDAGVFQTRLTTNGDDVVVHGVKAYVEAGAEADEFVVTARTEVGLAQVAVPRDAPGISVVAGRSVDFVRRFAEVRFDQVRLSRSSVLCDGEPVAAAVERQLQLALLLQCAETNGALERAFEFTVEYMGDRYAFGRPIASFQALKHRLADMQLRIQSCMATTDAAAEAFDARSPDAHKLSRVAKTYVGAESTAIVSDLVQMTGGIAVTWDHDLHLYERRIAVNRAVFGTPEYHRSEVHRLISQ
jgi:alkylation response protein AidB-like acyl-CoA dehydrogenase